MERFVVLYGRYVESIHNTRDAAEVAGAERQRGMASDGWSESEWRDDVLQAHFWYRDGKTNRWNKSLLNIQTVEDAGD